DLNGHTVSMGGNGGVIDVHSEGRHAVFGPGNLVNVGIACGVGFHYARSLQVRGVDFVSTPYGAIDCLDQDGFRKNPLSVRDVHITGSSVFGITGQDVKVRDISIAGSSLVALMAVNVKGQGVSIVGNGGSAIRSDFSSAHNVLLKDA